MYKILLIDDEELILQSLKETFPWQEVNGYVAATARNGKEGIERFREIQPDLIITDIKMPDMDGLEFLKEIFYLRSADEVIILSGYDDFKFVQEALTYKAFQYLLKPIDREELKEAIKRALKEIDKKNISNRTSRKNKLLDAAFPHQLKVKATPVGERGNFAALKVVSVQQNRFKATRIGENSEYFVYPLSKNDMLFLGYGPFIYDTLYNLAETWTTEDLESIAALAPEVDELSKLSDSMEKIDLYMKHKDYIGSSFLNEKVYHTYQSFENQSNKLLLQAKEYVEQHYYQPLTIEEVAKRFGFSPSYFSTLYKEVNGQTFSEHLKETRIEHACDLLIHTNKPAYEIANMVGYEDQRYFSQVFRKRNQLTPSQYRKLYQK